MITKTGENLDVLIATTTSKNWEAFATWYSVFKNLPDANITISCLRDNRTPFQLFQWAKRVKVKTFHFNPFSEDIEDDINLLRSVQISQQKGFVSENILLLTPLTMVLSPLEDHMLSTINTNSHLTWVDKNAWLLKINKKQTEEYINKHYLEGNSGINTNGLELSYEAKDMEMPKPIVSYKKGCGKWIDTSKGCPFSNAGGLASEVMTVNERKIIDLWKRMVSLFSVIV